ncbi:glycine cleavage system aminomethyltransferase GcvT [Agreia sp. COWG]|uniref:glycine cleavage system aminomethyltransferase GcvT n=1 Tax=Agreia sp. COWG TaxID=2773266 RepID=UPI001F00477A|nr:glycine cleavage system aminomethyltransferase GcvT [Agreia sp. COWG]
MTDRYSPLHRLHVDAGASFTDFAGWQMPVRYSSDLAEHHAVRTAAGIFDLSHMGEIYVVGPEASDALDYAFAGRLSAIEVGQAKYSLLLNREGGIIDDVVVYRTGDDSTGGDKYMVVANASNREVVASELEDRTAPFECEVFDESDELALIAVQGPRSRDILIATNGFAIEGGHPDGRDVAEKLAALKYYRALPGSFAGQPALIARTGYTGEDGFEIYISPDHAEELWGALIEAGDPLGLVPAGLASRDTLRLEAGMPLYGHELGTETLPVQAGLGRVVALATKEDFVGREAIETGPAPDARVLVGLVAEGKRAARADYAVFADDDSTDAIGVITSGALSPSLGVPIAMAYVAPELSAADTVLSVDIRGKRLSYRVTTLPFYRRKKD